MFNFYNLLSTLLIISNITLSCYAQDNVYKDNNSIEFGLFIFYTILFIAIILLTLIVAIYMIIKKCKKDDYTNINANA